MAKIQTTTTGKKKTLTPLYSVETLDTGKTFKAYNKPSVSLSTPTTTSTVTTVSPNLVKTAQNNPQRRTTGGGGVNRIEGSTLDKTGKWVKTSDIEEKVSKTKTNIADVSSRARERANELMANRTVVNRPLSELNMELSKSARYRQIASNLATLSSQYTESAGNKQKGWEIGKAINSGLAAIIGLATGGPVGLTIATTLASGLNAGAEAAFSTVGKDQAKASLYNTMGQNITDYLTNLTSRDTTIMNTMDQLYSSMDTMRGTYGADFVNNMYNYYLAQSGMTSDAYSMLTGNFRNFELGNGNYGKESGENGIFDTLTDGNQDLFDNMYAQLQLGDITSNENLMNSLVQSLYGGETEFALTMQGYENELRTALRQSMLNQSQLIYNARADLGSQGAYGRSENISATESIGSAQAEAASSGVRGGTSGNNEALARLSRDLGQIQRTANTAAVIGSLKYNIQNAQLNASSTAYSYRNAQQKALTGALNQTVSTWNSIGRNLQGGDRSANYYLEEAKSNQRQFEENYEKMRESDKDKMIAVT